MKNSCNFTTSNKRNIKAMKEKIIKLLNLCKKQIGHADVLIGICESNGVQYVISKEERAFRIESHYGDAVVCEAESLLMNNYCEVEYFIELLS